MNRAVARDRDKPGTEEVATLYPFSAWLSLRCVAATAESPLGVLGGDGLEPRMNGRLQGRPEKSGGWNRVSAKLHLIPPFPAKVLEAGGNRIGGSSPCGGTNRRTSCREAIHGVLNLGLRPVKGALP